MMKKSCFKRNKTLFIFGLILILMDSVIMIAFFRGNLSGLITLNKEFSYNLLTVCSVFGGFVYSTLGSMIGFSSNNRIKKLDYAGYMDKYYNGTYISLTLFLISILLGFITAFSEEGLRYHIIFLFQLIFTMNALVYFTLSVLGFRRLINKIRNSE
ncbi:hypothetical protein RF371_11605 [Companilactobacillus paralimentarius]|uniref:hypothetical protein n=1 Tax=Companilactobacillus paralimentarius TaxID=83526 RepID=UPI0028530F3C|nr:hypothetical protein [Companilactobacillus paralimentarius]MDR4934437.1 hypothetical protein [Companilactobacillus paralimentarius]